MQAVTSTYLAILHNPDEIAKTFQTNKAKIILVLPSTFGNDLRHLNKAQVQLIADASDPNTATTLINYATAIITDYQQSLNETAPIPYHDKCTVTHVI